MNFSFIQLIFGFILALVISGISYQLKVLTLSGAIASTILGTVVFGLGGFPWAIVLLGFFISSSGLSKILKSKKQDVNEKFSKGATRDAAQVFANGGIAGLFVVLHVFFPQATWPWLAFAGAFAAVNADTWGTELGVLSPKQPISIISGKKVEKGTSGGVSLAGTAAAFAGSLFIAILAVIFWPKSILNPMLGDWWLPVVGISLAGLFGSLIDSLLGATVQVIYYCPTCEKETEQFPTHRCDTKTTYVRGWKWLNNDWVNGFCALSGALFMIISVIG